MAKTRHIQHLKSKLTTEAGLPKLPSSSILEYGEIAINYHKGTETISLKNDNNEVVSFYDEVEIGSGTPKAQTEIFIDTSDETVTEIYTKQQMDSVLSGITSKDYEQDDRLDALERKTDDISRRHDYRD